MDRGHKKCGGLFLPEHRERLQEWVLEQSAVPKPIRCADRLEELNRMIHECLQDHSNIIITYCAQNQFQQMKECYIVAI